MECNLNQVIIEGRYVSKIDSKKNKDIQRVEKSDYKKEQEISVCMGLKLDGLSDEMIVIGVYGLASSFLKRYFLDQGKTLIEIGKLLNNK